MIDIGAAGDSAGDLLTFANKLYDETNTSQVGRDPGQLHPDQSGSRQLAVQLHLVARRRFGHGRGSVLRRESTFAITGGTGRYHDATGTMRLGSRPIRRSSTSRSGSAGSARSSAARLRLVGRRAASGAPLRDGLEREPRDPPGRTATPQQRLPEVEAVLDLHQLVEHAADQERQVLGDRVVVEPQDRRARMGDARAYAGDEPKGRRPSSTSENPWYFGKAARISRLPPGVNRLRPSAACARKTFPRHGNHTRASASATPSSPYPNVVASSRPRR